MKFLIIDTETTGLFDFKRPADAQGQPRLAQAGFIYLDHIDDEPVKVGRYIKPDGWTMPETAGRVNGLTTEFLAREGVPVSEVLDLYASAVEEGYVVVAFNAQFDCKVMRAEMRRAGRDDLFESTKQVCVMRPLTEIIRIPRKTGSGLKFPNLAEACAFYGIKNEAAHDAMGDAEVAMKIMLNLHRAGQLPEPKVHYARNRPQ